MVPLQVGFYLPGCVFEKVINVPAVILFIKYYRNSKDKEFIVSYGKLELRDVKTGQKVEMNSAGIVKIKSVQNARMSRLPWSFHEYFKLIDTDRKEIVVTSYIMDISDFLTDCLTRFVNSNKPEKENRYYPLYGVRTTGGFLQAGHDVDPSEAHVKFSQCETERQAHRAGMSVAQRIGMEDELRRSEMSAGQAFIYRTYRSYGAFVMAIVLLATNLPLLRSFAHLPSPTPLRTSHRAWLLKAKI